MARIDTLSNFLTDVADAIRTKKGTSGAIAASDFDTEIENLPSGGDISEYFEVEPISVSSSVSDPWLRNNFIKKMPDITIPNTTTSLSYFAYNWYVPIVPKIIAGSNITNMSNMFYGCAATNIDFSGLDFTNVTTLNTFLRGCAIKYLDFSNLTFPLVTNVGLAFGTGPSQYTYDSYINLENSEFPSLTNASSMFSYCRAYNINLKNVDFSQVTTFSGMFSGFGNNDPTVYHIIDFTGCNMPLVRSLYSMFGNNYAYKIKVIGLDTSNATDFTNMFNSYSCREIVLNDFDTKKVTTMSNCFSGCYQYNSASEMGSLDLSSWETPALTNTSGMFNNCKKLIHIDMRKFDFTNVTNFTNMFGASASNGVPDDCEIIVKDNDAKDWIEANFTRLTNVKTVVELS